MSILLKTSALTKVMEGREIVSQMNIRVRQGEIYGLLGPNGAGKTTLMRMLTSLVRPTAGEIELFGERLQPGSVEYLKRIGSIIEYPVFYEKLTATANLELHCEYMGYYNKNAINEALELVRLQDAQGRLVKEFSLGMKQRLGIARAIVTRPELLFLDEPINGLDPMGIRELRELLYRLCKEYGMTLIVSSHILGEIEQIADTICVMNKGRLVKEVPMNEIRGAHTEYIELHTPDPAKAAYVLEHDLNLFNFRVTADCIRIYETMIPQTELSKQLIMHEVPIHAIHRKNQSLEQYFVQLIQGGE
ncbi:ABC transporter ATP-binding protein [Paenibacillus sp. SYP-B4298]|uniref:ABC transporter ATP-binding protein n=1 Tax=Paenibacillus sp. SYP-B4298 TaxID=2996034 RepID=UPI0022DD6B86|nr:ATP-binding cassette domain-containing protein [Paenibacillus sp. SYP-B4298]